MPADENNDPAFSSLRNHFLLAMPGLTDAMFSHSITYICEHNEQGAMGLVINHPLDLSVGDVLKHLELDAYGQWSDVPVLAGGPVKTDRGFVLHQPTERKWDSSVAVTDQIHLTTSRDILAALAADESLGKAVITLGYAGWSAGQLEHEILENSWLTLPADSAIIFETPYQNRATAAAAGLGIDLNLLSGEAGHA